LIVTAEQKKGMLVFAKPFFLMNFAPMFNGVMLDRKSFSSVFSGNDHLRVFREITFRFIISLYE
jgi:hypothetical protein